MGWTGIEVQGRGVTNIQILKRNSSLWVGSKWGSTGAVAEIEVEALQNGIGGVYGILKQTNRITGCSVRFALIVLFERVRGEARFKEMTEFEGPCETGIPESLFRRLSSLKDLETETLSTTTHAADWRLRVEERLRLVKRTKALKAGDVIELLDPVSFNFGSRKVEVQRFRIECVKPRRRLCALPTSGPSFPCRLSRYIWQNRPFEVIV
jgi:hypothetical protein